MSESKERIVIGADVEFPRITGSNVKMFINGVACTPLDQILVEECDRVTVECVSCKSGPFVAVDETEVLQENTWGGPMLSNARPGKPVSVTRTIRVTRRMLQTEPTVIQGSLADIEAAGWEEGEYGWTCKACTEKATAFIGIDGPESAGFSGDRGEVAQTLRDADVGIMTEYRKRKDARDAKAAADLAKESAAMVDSDLGDAS